MCFSMIHQASREDLVQIKTEKPAVPEEMKLVVLATPSLLLNICSYTWEYASRAPPNWTRPAAGHSNYKDKKFTSISFAVKLSGHS